MLFMTRIWFGMLVFLAFISLGLKEMRGEKQGIRDALALHTHMSVVCQHWHLLLNQHPTIFTYGTAKVLALL
jgi:hypothetical protein